ncbi:MAG: ABC transporter ATP-binding protein [Deltaproteobacteria bacterium]|nr:ABC transporter ATP-binding protein [Deltaproteobacteria bacterium]
MLTIERINTFYDKMNVLSDVSIRVKKGQIVSILGANGAGKSTLLMSVSGIVPIRQGQIQFLGKRIDRSSPSKIVKLGISQVPEGRRIFPDLTVEENLKLGAFTTKKGRRYNETLDKVYEYFPRLKERRRQTGSTLSGGEQQMLAISRALMSQPRLLLLDEPSLGLSPILVKELFAIIKSISESGMTILLVEQNVNMSLKISDYAYILATGRVQLQGPSRELIKNHEVRETYLGKGKYRK